MSYTTQSRAQIWLGMQVARLLPRLPERLKRSISLLPREAVQGLRSIASLPLEDDRTKATTKVRQEGRE